MLGVALALLSMMAACGDGGSVDAGQPAGGGGAAEASFPPPDASTLAQLDPDVRFVASGEVADAEWWLFVKGHHGDQFGEEMCLEAHVDGEVIDSRCTTPELGTSVPPEATVVGLPRLSEGEPRFAFGQVGPSVARVVVGLDSGAALEAPVVGDARTHYVVALPRGVSPVTVEAHGAGGEVLARRDLVEDDAASPEWWESCVPSEGGLDCGDDAVVTETCEPAGPDGEIVCRFGAEPAPEG